MLQELPVLLQREVQVVVAVDVSDGVVKPISTALISVNIGKEFHRVTRTQARLRDVIAQIKAKKVLQIDVY